MAHTLSSYFRDLPTWRIALQDYVANHILSFKDLDFKHAKVLDLGCGLGYTLAKLSRLLPHEAELVGIDTNRESVSRAKKLLRRTGSISTTEVKCVKAEKTRFNDEEFDIIISNLSLSAVSNRYEVAAEAVRILKPNGKLIATEVNRLSVLGKLGELFDKLTGNLYYTLYSPNELTRLLTCLGLKLKKVSKIPLKVKVLHRYIDISSRVSPVFLVQLYKPSFLSQAKTNK